MKHRSENYRFANTNSYLLIVTMVVSVLHMIFEYLALKHDAPWHARPSISRQNEPKRTGHERERERGVLFLFSCLCVQSETLENFAFCKAEVLFWQKTDAETLKRYVSLRAIFGEIFCILVALSGKSAPDPGFHRSFSWRIHSCSWIEGFNVSAVQSIWTARIALHSRQCGSLDLFVALLQWDMEPVQPSSLCAVLMVRAGCGLEVWSGDRLASPYLDAGTDRSRLLEADPCHRGLSTWSYLISTYLNSCSMNLDETPCLLIM